jgi:DNA helicase-2/ATP-dependent DNA helicase PcrA
VSLSPQQQAVVDHRGGHLQVIACAGAGKTESISRRMAALIAGGAKPESIIAFTFTDKAAAELKERVVRRVGETLGKEFLDRLGPMYVGTIHSYCFRLLQTYVPKYGNYDVLDENRHAGFLSREFRTLGLKDLAPKHWEAIEEFQTAADVISNELVDVDDVPGKLGDCYRAYLAALDRYHFLTFGRLIALAVEELGDIGVFSRIHSALTHLFVDEYQDINPAQERLIQILATDPVKLCVVGDDDQSIYQWRGADVRNILEFARRHDGVTTHVLDTNRRSRPGIIAVANRFAASIKPRLEKTMAPARAGSEAEVSTWLAGTPGDEAAQIAETIERLAERGHAYRDIAVLYRSVRTSGPPLIEALDRRNIPYTCAGRTGLFLQPEVALFGQIHAWFADNEWQSAPFSPFEAVDIDAVVAGLNAHFGMGKTIKGLKKYLVDWKSDRLSGARSVSLVGDFYSLLNFLGAHSTDVDTKAGAARFGAFARFSKLLADFEHVTRY